LLLPALSSAKSKAQGMTCLNNQKQLALAWMMYADENNDQMVGFYTDLKVGNWWVEPDLVSVPPSPPTWTPEQVWKYKVEMGFKNPGPKIDGPLYNFAHNTDILHCPSDPWYLLSMANGYRWDSYSGVGGLNGESTSHLSKRTDVRHVSERFLWVEGADGRNFNKGSWLMTPGTAAQGFSDAVFGDSPAAFHGGTTASFSFADGHVEMHRWLDPATVAYAVSMSKNKDSGSTVKSNAQHPGNVDAIWCGRQYATPDNP